MTRYLATYTRADGSTAVLDLIASTAWDAIDAALDAAGDTARRLHLRRVR